MRRQKSKKLSADRNAEKWVFLWGLLGSEVFGPPEVVAGKLSNTMERIMKVEGQKLHSRAHQWWEPIGTHNALGLRKFHSRSQGKAGMISFCRDRTA